MLRGAAYEEGRIHQKELDPKDCAMKITNIIQADDGNWNCNVTSKLSNGEYDIGTAKIQIIVATPPVEVYMKIEEKLITGPIIMNLEENNQTFVKCIATGMIKIYISANKNFPIFFLKNKTKSFL